MPQGKKSSGTERQHAARSGAENPGETPEAADAPFRIHPAVLVTLALACFAIGLFLTLGGTPREPHAPAMGRSSAPGAAR